MTPLQKSARTYLRIVANLLPMSEVYTATPERRAQAKAANLEASEYLRALYRQYGRESVRQAIKENKPS